MQFLGLVMAVLAFAGGLFYPLKQAAQILQDIAKWTPLYGLNQLVHAPLLGGSIDIMWVVNAVAWFVPLRGRGGLAVQEGHGASLMIDFAAGAPVAGDLDVRWIHGHRAGRGRYRSGFQVHAYDPHTYVLRQSKTSQLRGAVHLSAVRQ